MESSDPHSMDFWAIAEGRALPPPSARLVKWRFIGLSEDGVLCSAFEATEAFLNPAGCAGQYSCHDARRGEGPVLPAVSREPVFIQTLEMKISYMAAKPIDFEEFSPFPRPKFALLRD